MRDPGPIALAWMNPDTVPYQFLWSLENFLRSDAAAIQSGKPGMVLREWGGTIKQRSSPRIVEVRNSVVREFLTSPILAGTPWLLFVDCDMEWTYEDVEKMLYVADPKHSPIVGGLCFGGLPDRSFPTIYTFAGDEHGGAGVVKRVDGYERGGLIQCDATGAAFLLVHRNVLIDMANHFGTRPGRDGRQIPSPTPWFAEFETADGGVYGEDVTFCWRARFLGYPIKIHTEAKIGHVKTVALNEERWLAERKAADDA